MKKISFQIICILETIQFTAKTGGKNEEIHKIIFLIPIWNINEYKMSVRIYNVYPNKNHVFNSVHHKILIQILNLAAN